MDKMWNVLRHEEDFATCELEELTNTETFTYIDVGFIRI